MREPVHSRAASGRYRFGVFDFDTATLELYKSGRLVGVRPQSLKLLVLLVTRSGELVSRDDIQQALWGRETFVDFEQGVNHCVKELRDALGDAAGTPRYIQTLPRRGYRFIAPVERVTVDDIPLTEGPAPQSIPAAGSRPRSSESAAGEAARVTPGATVGEPFLARRSRRAWLAASGIAVVLAGAWLASFAAWPRGDLTSQLSTLTVLPFSTPEDPALGIGLANAISSRLGGQQVVSIQRMVGGMENAASGRSGSEASGRPSGRALVLEGDLSASGADMTVLVRLKDAARGVTVWSDRFKVHRDELFSVEDVVAERIVTALELRLAAAEQERLRRRYTSNAAAYEEYLRGRAALVRYTPDGTVQAIQAFEGALQRDPTYALARAGLAMASADMYLRFAPAADAERWGERTEAEASAALDLDADLAEAHLARAAVARKREFDWNATIAASRRALRLNQNLAHARFFISAAYYHLGYMEEALIEMEKGRALGSVDVLEPVRIAALVALFSGNFGPARVRLEEVSRLSSTTIGDTYLALAYYYTGNVDRGQTMLESLAMHPSASTAARSRAALAGVLAAQGDFAAARREVERVVSGDYRDHHVAYSLGAAHAQLGETGDAVRWLRTAADTGFPCLPWFQRDPLLEPLRLRTEFAELLGYVRARRDASLPKPD